MYSSIVSANTDATDAQYNNLRKDVLTRAGDFATTTGSSNAYAVTVDAQIVAYSGGLTVVCLASFSNTGAATINVNSIGAASIKKHGNVDLQTGDIRSGSLMILTHDGTNFQLMAAVDNLYTAKGDILAATANGAKSRLAVGSNGQVLVADSTATTGLTYIEGARALAVDDTDITIATSTVETTIFSATIPANVMRTKNVIKGRVFISTMALRASATCDFRLKFGGTTIATLNHDGPSGAASSIKGIIIEFTIYNNGSTGSQVGFINESNGYCSDLNSASVLTADGTASEDTTSSKTLTITAHFNDSNSATNLTAKGGEVFLFHRD